MVKIEQRDLKRLNQEFCDKQPFEILKWCIENIYPNLAMTTSFQISGMVILDIIKQLNADIPIYFIDTGYHFPETLKFRDEIIRKDEHNIITIKSKYTKIEFGEKFGAELYKSNPDKCCAINKIEPQERAMKNSGFNHWLVGLRKDQSKDRKKMSVFMSNNNGYIRVHPLINWKWEDVWKFIKENNIPYNKLYNSGYTSIGCSPISCTSPGDRTLGERNGRWVNTSKTECGLHQKLSSGE